MDRLWPQLERRWLFVVSAVMWAIAGSILLAWTTVWLLQVAALEEIALVHLGAIGALVAGRFIFLGVVRSSARRITDGPPTRWLLDFQSGRSYLVMAFMIALGVALRLSPIPRPVLAVVYEGIGGGLLLGSFMYVRRYLAQVRADRAGEGA